MTVLTPTVKLHLNKREQTFAVPVYITATVALISVVISLLFWRSGSVPGSVDWVQNSRVNPGIAWSLAGFLIYFGVQSVATTFPFALTLGASRRSFVFGTLSWAVLTSAYLTALFAVLLVAELVTDHWFVGFHIFDVNLLGAGEMTRLIPTVFFGALTMLAIGGVFAASWVRYGPRGPIALGAGVTVLLTIALSVAMPWLGEIAAASALWWLVVAAVGAIAIANSGMWLMLRSASVR